MGESERSWVDVVAGDVMNGHEVRGGDTHAMR